MTDRHVAAHEERAAASLQSLEGPPPGWAGGRGGLRWQALSAERRARIWSAHLGLTAADVDTGRVRVEEDRDDAGRLLRVVASHRKRLTASGARTDDADALLAKLSWSRTERRAA